MKNDFDYGFDLETLEELKTDTNTELETNELGDRISNGNEYDEGEKEAIEKWLKEHKKVS